jgi:two-component system, LytTR family, response regulator
MNGNKFTAIAKPMRPVSTGVPTQVLSVLNESRIAIKTGRSILLLNPEDVVSISAQGNYVALQCESGSHLLRESISAVADKMLAYGFVRIHRSILINRRFVEEIRPFLTGDYGLRLKSGKEFTVTRTYKKNLRALAESWIGGASSISG